jgi:hypothetical protein
MAKTMAMKHSDSFMVDVAGNVRNSNREVSSGVFYTT